MRSPHVLWAAVPVLAFLSTPFLPFVNGPYLWFGIPSVLCWCLIWTVGTTVALAVVDRLVYAGDAADADERDEVTAA